MVSKQASGISRREFLQWTGVGAAALAVAACAPAAPPAPGAASGGAAAPAQEKIVLRMQVNPKQEQPVVDMYKQDTSQCRL